MKNIDLSQLTNIIEIGHFYMNQNTYNIDYLSSDDIYKLVKDTKYNPVVFIDDVHIDHHILKLEHLKKDIEAIINREIIFVYESQLLEYNNTLYDFITVKTKSYRSGTEIKQQIHYNDKLYTVAELYPSYKLTCLGYSMIWSLLRTKMNTVETITIIDNKFKNIEDIVCFYINKVNIKYF